VIAGEVPDTARKHSNYSHQTAVYETAFDSLTSHRTARHRIAQSYGQEGQAKGDDCDSYANERIARASCHDQ
jgi:hypothetical protein